VAVDLVLPISAESPRRARELVRTRLAGAGLEAIADTACLLVSELVTNAVIHARTEAALVVDVSERVVQVRVGDGNARRPEPEEPDPWAARGRGLLLVDLLASRWGVSLEEEGLGKTIWFELDPPE